MDRRTFLDFAAVAGLASVVPNNWRVVTRPRFADDPFTLGVASGDPTPDGVMLWTRLAPRPLEPDGGMNGLRTVVTWEVAEDETFRTIAQSGRATAAPELGYSIHADVSGLRPDHWYFYRFTAGGVSSPVGRTRTTPAVSVVAPLNFAFASCQHYEAGYFTAYRHMAQEKLDLVAHLGDYIYESGEGNSQIRRHASKEILSLADYRMRYGQYKSDEHLRAAHAACPWLVTWDDHEVDNNYAGTHGENGMESVEQMRLRRAAAYQAWYEHQPVRLPRADSWADLTIRRSVAWGSLARFWVLDTRQYRSDQACGDGNKPVPCGDWADPSRTILGEEQERWLYQGLGESRASWQVLAQQIMLAPFDDAQGAAQRVSMDQWGGYPAARERLLKTVERRAAHRTVVLTGDIHSNWVNDVTVDFTRPGGKPVAAEFVGTSISSGGDGADRSGSVNDRTLPENPQLRWQNARRGYVTCRVTPDTWQTDYRTVPYITRPDAPVSTASSWVVQHGQPGIRKA